MEPIITDGHEVAFGRVGTDVEVCIGSVPGRKSIGLSVKRGAVANVVGYFRNEDAARDFIEGLREVVRPTNVHEQT